jgi:hypothetical protein
VSGCIFVKVAWLEKPAERTGMMQIKAFAPEWVLIEGKRFNLNPEMFLILYE